MKNTFAAIKFWMDKILSIACAVLLTFMTVLVLIQVFSRYILNSPVAFTEELVRYSLIWTGFIGAAYAFSTREHMSLTLIRDKFTGKAHTALLVAIDGLILLMAIFVFTIGGFKLAVSASREFSALLGIPRSLVYSIAPISGVFIVLAQANILGNMLFGALSGSSVAAASAMGGCISPIEEENGYDPAYSAAANIASAPTGLLIPPTSAFIVYSTVAGGVSISTLFMAGYIPGILMGLCCMLVAFVGAKKAGMKATGYDKSKSIGKTIWDAVPSLLLIVIVIGGIVSGIFTATEGAGIAVLYCLVLSIVYKSITFKSFLKILLDSAKTSGIILFLISASSAMSFVMAYSGIPAAISNGLMSLTSNKYIIFLLMNIILLVIGMFMDITPAILIFTPIFLPIATSFGMTEIQFGVMLIFNMCLGNITPPVGSVLFVGCGIGHVSIEQVTSKLIPYFVALVLALLAVTYIPALSLGLPSLMGLI